MKILVISDIHLTHRFKKRKYNFLKGLISKYDKVIICGDFWSAYSCTFDRFLDSKWNQIFPLLKQKNTVYLYGNHDRKRWNDKRVYRFCKQARKAYSLTIGEVTYHFTHGVEYLVDSINNEIFMYLHRKLGLDYISSLLDKIALKILGFDKYINFAREMNEIQKFSVSLDTRVSVMGHTHSPEIDLENGYVNLGFINNGYASYLEIEDRECRLIKTKY